MTASHSRVKKNSSTSPWTFSSAPSTYALDARWLPSHMRSRTASRSQRKSKQDSPAPGEACTAFHGEQPDSHWRYSPNKAASLGRDDFFLEWASISSKTRTTVSRCVCFGRRMRKALNAGVKNLLGSASMASILSRSRWPNSWRSGQKIDEP